MLESPLTSGIQTTRFFRVVSSIHTEPWGFTRILKVWALKHHNSVQFLSQNITNFQNLLVDEVVEFYSFFSIFQPVTKWFLQPITADLNKVGTCKLSISVVYYAPYTGFTLVNYQLKAVYLTDHSDMI